MTRSLCRNVSLFAALLAFVTFGLTPAMVGQNMQWGQAVNLPGPLPDSEQALRDGAQGNGLPMWGFTSPSFNGTGPNYNLILLGGSFRPLNPQVIPTTIVPVIVDIIGAPTLFDPTLPIEPPCQDVPNVPLDLTTASPLFNVIPFGVIAVPKVPTQFTVCRRPAQVRVL